MAEAPTEKLTVFISYSREDLDFADHLDVALGLAGFTPILDRHGIHGAENWQEKLGALIRDADTVVFVLTPASAGSAICHWEVKQAVALGKRILPVAAKPLGEVAAPPELAALNYIHFYADPKKPGSGVRSGSEELIKALKTDLGWMQRHTRLLQRALEWDAGGRNAHRLLSGGDIVEAKAWIAARPSHAPAPTDLHIDFIKESEAEEERQRNERERELALRERLVKEAETAAKEREAALEREGEARREREAAQIAAAEAAKREAETARKVARRTTLGLAASLVLAIGALGAGWYAWTQRHDAVMQAGRAETASREAQTQAALAEEKSQETLRQKEATEKIKTQAQTTESGLLANAAREITDKGGDYAVAVLLALEALPDKAAGIERRYVPEAEFELDRALRALRERAVLTGHERGVTSVAWSPDGTRLATASYDNTARLWDAATGKEVARLEGHGNSVTSVAWSPDGTRLATASWDNTARLWDAATGREIARLEGHERGVTSVAWSPDGTRLATASDDNTARLWDAATGREIARLEGHGNSVTSVAWSPDGTRLATASDDNTARLWDAATGREIARLEGHERGVTSVAWSPDGTRLATASDDNTARLWDAATGREIARLEGHGSAVTGVAWSPDGTRLATASWDRTARLWDAATSKEIARLEGHERGVTSVAWSPDGTRLATASWDKMARLWDAATGKEIARLEGHGSAVNSVAWSPDGTRLATASRDSTARLWDAAAGREISRLEGHGNSVTSVAWGPDGTRLATASWDNTARLWDVATSKEVARLEGHGNSVTSVAWSPDGTRLATASDDNTARLWDAATGKEIARLEGHGSAVNSVAWSPDGTRLATASWDNTARLWDVATSKEIARLEGHTDAVTSVAWSPDGTRLATASHDNTARLWDAATGKEIARLEGHGSAVNSVAWSPDGTRLATASRDSTARLWDAAAGREISRLEGHGDSVTGVAWSPDGLRIVTASDDQTARLWQAFPSTEQLVQAAKSRMGRCLTADERTRYFLTDAPPGWCTDRRLWPHDPASCVARADERYRAKDYSGAVSEASLALDRTEDGERGDWLRSRAYLARGRARHGSGDASGRDADFAEAQRLGLSVTDELIGACWEQDLSECDLSVTWAARDGASSHEHSRALFARGKAHESAGIRDKATADFEAAGPAMLKEIVTFYSDISNLRLVSNKADEALAAAETALKWASRDGASADARPRAFLIRGKVHAFAGDLDKANADFEAAGPDMLKEIVDYYTDISTSHLRVGKTDEAVAAAETAVMWASRRAPEDAKATALLARGKAMLASNVPAKALADFQEAERLGLKDAATWIWFGVMSLAADVEREKPAEALMIMLPHALGLEPARREIIGEQELKSSALLFAFPISRMSAAIRLATKPLPAPTECDRLASHPFDPLRVADGVDFDTIADAGAAITACTSALEASPGEPRLLFQRARAHAKAAKDATKAGNEASAKEHTAANLADLAAAMERGYPIAFNNQASALADGKGVEKDEAKAANLYLEYFNRVVHCCWAPVARQLLAEEETHGKEKVRNAVRAMTLWSTALGSEESRALLAELTANGTLAPADPLPPATFTDLPPWLRVKP